MRININKYFNENYIINKNFISQQQIHNVYYNLFNQSPSWDIGVSGVFSLLLIVFIKNPSYCIHVHIHDY